MEKKTLRTAEWLKSAFLLVVMLIGSLSASAVTTEELSLGELTPGNTYSIGVNTHVTGSFTAPSDGTIVLTSSVDANTNLVPYSDADYTNVISTVRDDVARTKTFEALSGTTYYFAQTTSPTTSFDVVLTFTPAEEPEPEVLNVTFSPDPSVPVESLQTVTITFPDYADKYVSAPGTPAIYDANGNAISSFGTMNAGMGSATMYIVPSAITAAGTYTIKFTEGSFSVDGKVLPAFEVTYTIGSAVEPEPDDKSYFIPVSVTPADGSVVASLSEVDLKFSHQDMYFTTANRYDAAIVYDADRNQVATGYMSNPSSDYYTVRFTINPIITEPGEYTVVVQSGRFNYQNDTSNTNPEYSFTYTIEASEEPGLNLTFSPDPSVAVETLDKVTATFTDYASAYIANQYNNAKLYKDGSVVDGVTVSYMVATGKVDLLIVPAVTESGVYTIKVPEGDLMAIAGSSPVALPGFEVTYTVEAKEVVADPVATWSIAEGAVLTEGFESVTVTFEGVESAKSSTMYPYSFYAVSEDGTATLVENFCTAGVMDASASGNVITYSLDLSCYSMKEEPYNVSGNYRIVIPAGGVYFNGDKANTNAEEYVLNFTIEGEEPAVEIDATFTADPANNATVSELKEVVLTFPGYESITVAELDLINGSNIPYVYMVDELTGSAMPAGYIFFEAGAASNAMRLYVPAEYMGMDSYTAEGSYMIRIPAGVVTFADGVNKEIILNYTVGAVAPADPAATWSIAEGAVLTEGFESVTVTFEGVESAKATSTYSNFIFYVVAEDGTATLVENFCTAGYMDTSASGNVVTYSLDLSCYSKTEEPYNVSGNYRIVIPAGGVYFNGDKANTNTEEYVLNFTIEGEEPAVEIDATFTADPANNATISELKEVVLTFPGYESITVAELDLINGSNIPYVYMVDELTGSAMPAGYIFFEAGAASNAMRLYVPAEYMGMDSYTAEGSYMIRIPAGVVTFADGVNKEIILNYTVKEGGAPVATYFKVTPAENTPETAYEGSILPIKFQQVDEIVNVDPVFISTTAYIYKDDNFDEVYSTAHMRADDVLWTTVLIERVSEGKDCSEAGKYTVVINAGSYELNGVANDEVRLTYYVTSNDPGEEPVKGAPIRFNPESGSTVESIYRVGIYFNQSDYPEGIDVTYFGTPEVYKDGELISTDAYYNYDSSDWWLGYVDFQTPITEPGEYTIKVAAGHFYEYLNESNAAPAFEISYTVVASENTNPGPISVDPKSGETVEKIEVITLMFGENDYPEGMEVNSSTLLPVLDKSGTEVAKMKFAPDYNDYYKVTGTIYGEAITAEGVYTITIPEGHIWEYGNKAKAVPAIELTYTVAGGGSGDVVYGALPVSIEPADGSTIESLKNVTFTFSAEDYPNTMNYDYLQKAEVYDAEGNLVTKGGYGYSGNEFLAIYVQFEKEITVPGTYTVKVGEGHILEYNYDAAGNYIENPKICPAFEVTYIVGDSGEVESKLASVVPAQGELDLALYGGVFRGLSMTFSESLIMVADDLLPSDMITIAINGEVKEEIALKKISLDDFVEDNTKADIVFANKYSEGGEYIITIPAGWATFADGSVVEEIVLTYTVPVVEYTNDYETDPEEGEVDSLTKIYFEFTDRPIAYKNSKTVLPSYEWYGKPYVIDDATGEKVTDIYFYHEEAAAAFGLDLNKPIVAPGSYTVVIPQGQISFVQHQNPTADEVNPEFRLHYTIVGEQPQEFNVTVDPAEGVVESLSVVKVTFDDVEAIELNDEGGIYPCFYKVTTNGDVFECNGEYSVSGNVFTFSVYEDEGTGELEAITEEGKYAFVIPSGLIKVNGVFTTEYRFEYQIGEAASLTIADPVPGSVVERLDKFTVIAPGATTLEENETRAKIQITQGDESVCVVSVVSTEGNTIVLQAASPVTTSGEYSLVIPKGYFLIDGVMTEEEYTFDYTVENGTTQFVLPTIDPEEGFVEEFTQFVLTWENAASVAIDNSAMMGTAGIAMYDAMDNKVSDFIGMGAGDNAIMLNFMGAAPAEAGEYRLVVPAGLITVDGAVSEEMTFVYQLLPAIDIAITIDKQGLVQSVAEFVLTFDPCEESVEINSECESSVGLWTVGYPEELIAYYEVTIEGNTAKLELTVEAEEVEDGEYTILVPAEYFIVDGQLCDGETFNVTLQKVGIYDIEADAKGLDVYSVSGILVLRDAKATDLKNLQKGIYIVNGKKILVR